MPPSFTSYPPLISASTWPSTGIPPFQAFSSMLSSAELPPIFVVKRISPRTSPVKKTLSLSPSFMLTLPSSSLNSATSITPSLLALRSTKTVVSVTATTVVSKLSPMLNLFILFLLMTKTGQTRLIKILIAY